MASLRKKTYSNVNLENFNDEVNHCLSVKVRAASLGVVKMFYTFFIFHRGQCMYLKTFCWPLIELVGSDWRLLK